MGDTASLSALRTAIDVALAARDRASAVQAALDAVSSNDVSIDDLYTQVLTPLMVDTGALWQQKALRVWEEHFASATVRTIVESLYLEVERRAEQNPGLGQVAVLACPPGELHDLGLRMIADRMRLAGWDTYFLGADTPIAEVADAAASLKADLVVLAAATHYNRAVLRQGLDELKAALPRTRIGVGGPAFAGDPDWASDEVLTDCNLGIVHDGTCEL